MESSYQEAKNRSRTLMASLAKKDVGARHLVLTGDRPTGKAHIGHLFGSFLTRLALQEKGVPLFVVIADYQVFTDRLTSDEITENTLQLTMDYLAVGLNPLKHETVIFPHSHVPELNQLLLPFLTLVSLGDLDRNPTVKEEIFQSQGKNITAATYTYPVHQAADILFCKGTLVPVGKDQLPHLEIARKIAKRFNQRFCPPERPLFPLPEPLLSQTPLILGLDGGRKMGKSYQNAVFLSDSEDTTQERIRKAKTDANPHITFDPDSRPEVANLLTISALCSGCSQESIAEEVGSKGARELKETTIERLNEYLRPLRERRRAYEKDPQAVREILKNAIPRVRAEGEKTLQEVRQAMGMAL